MLHQGVKRLESVIIIDKFRSIDFVPFFVIYQFVNSKSMIFENFFEIFFETWIVRFANCMTETFR